MTPLALALLLASAVTPERALVRHEGSDWLLHWNSNRDGNYEIYRQESDGRESNLTRLPSNEWLWSAHDGRLYALGNAKTEGEAKGWRAASLENGQLRRLGDEAVSDGFLDCHPDGSTCLVDAMIERKRHVLVRDGKGRPLRAFDDGSHETSDPQFSPAGKRVLHRSTRSGSWELWLSDLDGGNAVQLTRDPGNDALPSHEYGGEGPARFSPDGKRIVWMRKFPGQGYDIWTMASDGSDARNLTGAHAGDEGYPSYSPDGAQIAFDSDRDGDNEIYVMAADGSAPRRITHSKGADLAPLWVRQP